MEAWERQQREHLERIAPRHGGLEKMAERATAVLKRGNPKFYEQLRGTGALKDAGIVQMLLYQADAHALAAKIRGCSK